MGRAHDYDVTVDWTGGTSTGTASYQEYSRAHDISAAGKPVIAGSADPYFRGDPTRWNPEELLIASLSECHMLTYLALCSLQRVVVTRYTDTAHGRMEESGGGGRFTEVVLHPVVTVADASMVVPATELHHRAQQQCFIANSISFPLRHQPVIRVQADV